MSTFCSIICCKKEEGYDSRHFHQLFRQLRIAKSGSHRNIVRQDLGHFDNLLGIRHERVKEMQVFGNCSAICGTIASRICTMGAKRTKSTMCSTVCRWTRCPGRTPAVSSSNNSKNTASPAALDFCLRGALLAASPAPVRLSSVPLGRRTFHQPPPCRSCGGRQRRGKLRRSAAHVSTMSAGVAVHAGKRRRVSHEATCRPLGSTER